MAAANPVTIKHTDTVTLMESTPQKKEAGTHTLTYTVTLTVFLKLFTRKKCNKR